MAQEGVAPIESDTITFYVNLEADGKRITLPLTRNGVVINEQWTSTEGPAGQTIQPHFATQSCLVGAQNLEHPLDKKIQPSKVTVFPLRFKQSRVKNNSPPWRTTSLLTTGTHEALFLPIREGTGMSYDECEHHGFCNTISSFPKQTPEQRPEMVARKQQFFHQQSFLYGAISKLMEFLGIALLLTLTLGIAGMIFEDAIKRVWQDCVEGVKQVVIVILMIICLVVLIPLVLCSLLLCGIFYWIADAWQYNAKLKRLQREAALQRAEAKLAEAQADLKAQQVRQQDLEAREEQIKQRKALAHLKSRKLASEIAGDLDYLEVLNKANVEALMRDAEIDEIDALARIAQAKARALRAAQDAEPDDYGNPNGLHNSLNG